MKGRCTILIAALSERFMFIPLKTRGNACTLFCFRFVRNDCFFSIVVTLAPPFLSVGLLHTATCPASRDSRNAFPAEWGVDRTQAVDGESGGWCLTRRTLNGREIYSTLFDRWAWRT